MNGFNIVAPASYNSTVVSSTFPTNMTAGQNYPVSIRFSNTGTLTWSNANGYVLGGVGGATGGAASFGPTTILIPTGVTVAPGAAITFTFNVTAPVTGNYTPQYQLVRSGTTWFGQIFSPGVHVALTGIKAKSVSDVQKVSAVPTPWVSRPGSSAPRIETSLKSSSDVRPAIPAHGPSNQNPLSRNVL